MKTALKNAGAAINEKLLKSNSLVSTFLRSGVSSQISSWTDMGIRMIFYAFIFSGIEPFYRSNLSVAIGAICGGIVNCCINYKFTFRASGQNVKAVGLKYFMVWTGSLLLNMYGTTFAAIWLSKWEWLINLGFKPDGIFAAATLTVSLLVSWFWNFLLQKNFVYRPTKFDATAVKIVDKISGKSRNNK